MDVLPRKRTRFCPHCEDVTHLVYKKHKEEFYDFAKKVWMKRQYKTHFEELDAEDDDIIRKAVATGEKIVQFREHVYLMYQIQ